jgi:hypothetical protein
MTATTDSNRVISFETTLRHGGWSPDAWVKSDEERRIAMVVTENNRCLGGASRQASM